MSNILTCSELAHNVLLKARKLERIVQSELFKRLVDQEECPDHIFQLVKACNTEALLKYMRSHAKRELEDLTFTEVRLIAKKLVITNYCRKPQWQLIKEIRAIHRDISSTIQGSLSITTLLEK